MPRRKVLYRCQVGVAIPWANKLTVIAAKDTITNGAAIFGVYDAIVLNGEIRDTGRGIKLVGRDNRLGRADVDTSAAAATMLFDWLIIGQLVIIGQFRQLRFGRV